jgi:hypothetical protein
LLLILIDGARRLAHLHPVPLIVGAGGVVLAFIATSSSSPR